MEQETYLERIKKLKSSRKLTNDKLSEMTGIPLGTLSKLLAGISDSPKLSNIVAISRALDCSLDWLITGVPENTNNYTLEPEEIDLVEAYRALDSYGRDLTMTVMNKERSRAERQADEEAIRFHDMARRSARRSARRGAGHLRRPSAESLPDGTEATASASSSAFGSVFRYASPASQAEPTVASAASASSAARPSAEERSSAEACSSAEKRASATILSVPKSHIDRIPAGLRRRSIGLYDMPVSAGVGEFLADSTRTDIVIPDDPRTAEADYALRINGDSMEPKYHSGDIILVQTTESVEAGELGIFVLDGSGYFKKYGGDHLISLNPQYPPIRLKDFDSVTCCGRVVGKLKKK